MRSKLKIIVDDQTPQNQHR